MNYVVDEVSMTKRSMTVDVEGKINSVNRFKTNALLPLYEAVVNSIHSVQRSDAKPIIKVKIELTGGIDEGSKTIDNISITDNGVGFDDDNMDSFLKSDSTFNSKFGCKGVGRFTWLCAFDHAHIRSVYDDQGTHRIREFDFTSKNSEIEMISDGDETTESTSTVVKLIGFKNEYKRLPTAYKKTKTIAEKIVFHCFEFFVADPNLEVYVTDDDGSESCREIIAEIGTLTEKQFEIGENKFIITHANIPDSMGDHVNQVLICGNNRVVERRSVDIVGKKPFVSEGKTFYYSGFVKGEFLDKNVSTDRTSFLIAEESNLDSGNDLTLSQIKKIAFGYVENYLNEFIEEVRKEKIAVLNDYMVRFPEYKAICNTDFDSIVGEMKPNSNLEQLNEIISTRLAKKEFKSRERMDKILSMKKNSSLEDIDEEVGNEIEKLKDGNKMDLIKSIVRRDYVLKLLEKKLEYGEGSDGKYSKEEAVHDILFPRRTYSDNIDFDDFNLWIIDERLLYHTFAASDIPIKDYLDESESKERPDILMAMTKEHSKCINSVCVVELKRPMRKDNEQTPVKQMLRYVKEIRSKKEVDHRGRPLIVNDSTLYYCYALCDITDAIREEAEISDMHLLPDGLGYYAYHQKLNAYIEILSYDKLLGNAYMNNCYMFRKLGLEVPKSYDPTR